MKIYVNKKGGAIVGKEHGSNAGTDFIRLSRERYDELLRAETERDILEAAISRKESWMSKNLLQCMQLARYRLKDMRSVVMAGDCDINPMIKSDAVGETDAE